MTTAAVRAALRLDRDPHSPTSMTPPTAQPPGRGVRSRAMRRALILTVAAAQLGTRGRPRVDDDRSGQGSAPPRSRSPFAHEYDAADGATSGPGRTFQGHAPRTDPH